MPKLSVVICIVSDAKHLEGCLDALSRQADPPSMETIVPYVEGERGLRDLQGRFPEVIFHEVKTLRSGVSASGSSREHHDELRAIGLGLAKGKIVALLEDHGRADPGWAREIAEAHRAPHAAVGGAIENEVDRPLNWAVYYCDFGRYQNPVKAGPTNFISDANISYKRSLLEEVRDLWEDSFHETSLNDALAARGETLWLSPDIVVYQHRENLSLIPALKERYVWGRSYAGKRAKEISFGQRMFYLAMSLALPFLLTGRKVNDVRLKKKLNATFMKACPLIFLLLTSWSFGELMGYLTARATSLETR